MTEYRGLDLNKLVMGLRTAVIEDLIKDLENLKYKIKEIDKELLINKLDKIIK